MSTETALITFEEFEQMPEQPGKQELLQGELIELPVAYYRHGRIRHKICWILDVAVRSAHSNGQAAELGDTYMEMGYKLPANSYVRPEVSVTRACQAEAKYLEGSPAVAIEVVSPDITAEALDIKTDLYFKFGAHEVWHVYQKTRHVIVHVPGSARVIAEHGAVTTPLLPQLALSVRDILDV